MTMPTVAARSSYIDVLRVTSELVRSTSRNLVPCSRAVLNFTNRDHQHRAVEEEGGSQHQVARPECAFVHVRVEQPVDALVEREERTGHEDEDGGQEGPEETLLAVAIGMPLIGRIAAQADADEKEELVDHVGEGVRRFRQHRRAPGCQPDAELGQRYPEVRRQIGVDNAFTPTGHVRPTPSLDIIRPLSGLQS